ncbi:MAG: peroxiredoxin [Pseudomonadota bacterium]|nr:peroxiredoxin [Pseudomonadota bacterium]
MKRKLTNLIILALMMGFSFMISTQTFALTDSFRSSIYNPGPLKPLDSLLKVTVGETAPDFTLPSVGGKKITLSDYRGKKIVVLSFVPAAWTPVCSDQWPGYNIVEELFKEQDAVLLGITVDNIPTLFSWIQQMGNLWFPVLSDFWPHGAVADSFGLLRRDGVAERALVVIDKDGVISYIGVGDINVRPPLEILIGELQKLNAK